jgi:uncharacterized protein (UPF0332 family)
MKEEFLATAKENLEAAQVLFDRGLYNASANRADYAAFQAAVAALAAVGFQDSVPSHKTVQAKFSAELIHQRKICPSKLKSYLLELQTTRNEADYGTEMIGKKDASRQLAKAREFVVTVEREISS